MSTTNSNSPLVEPETIPQTQPQPQVEPKPNSPSPFAPPKPKVNPTPKAQWKKFYVYIQGDESVGIFPDQATITIEDNFAYVDFFAVEQLKESIARIYNAPPSQVLTELQHNQVNLKEAQQHQQLVNDLIVELKANREHMLLKEMENTLRSAKKAVGSWRRKVTNTKKEYKRTNFWFEE